MKYIYLATLLLSFAGILFIDYSYKLALFYKAKQAALTMVCGLVLFLAWDGLGISLGIFFEGHSPYVTGLMLAPHLPVEEIFFLLFLCYFTLILYRTLEKLCSRI